MTDLLASLREKYDVVLMDTAPLLPVTDAAVLAPRVDGSPRRGAQGRTACRTCRRPGTRCTRCPGGSWARC